MDNCCSISGEYSLQCGEVLDGYSRIYCSNPPHPQDIVFSIDNCGNCPVSIIVNDISIDLVPSPTCEPSAYYSSNKNSKTFDLQNVYSICISCGGSSGEDTCCKGSYTICFFKEGLD